LQPSPAVLQAIKEQKQLPLLDLAPYLAGEPGALEQLAADVRAIQETLGFFAVINHGVPPALIENSFEQIKKLFRLSDEEKMEHRTGFHHQGFIPPKSLLL